MNFYSKNPRCTETKRKFYYSINLTYLVNLTSFADFQFHLLVLLMQGLLHVGFGLWSLIEVSLLPLGPLEVPPESAF